MSRQHTVHQNPEPEDRKDALVKYLANLLTWATSPDVKITGMNSWVRYGFEGDALTEDIKNFHKLNGEFDYELHVHFTSSPRIPVAEEPGLNPADAGSNPAGGTEENTGRDIV